MSTRTFRKGYDDSCDAPWQDRLISERKFFDRPATVTYILGGRRY
jgi:hypothetical protein